MQEQFPRRLGWMWAGGTARPLERRCTSDPKESRINTHAAIHSKRCTLFHTNTKEPLLLNWLDSGECHVSIREKGPQHPWKKKKITEKICIM